MLHWFSVSLSAQGDSALPSLLADDPVLWQRFSGLCPMGNRWRMVRFIHMFHDVPAKKIGKNHEVAEAKVKNKLWTHQFVFILRVFHEQRRRSYRNKSLS